MGNGIDDVIYKWNAKYNIYELVISDFKSYIQIVRERISDSNKMIDENYEG